MSFDPQLAKTMEQVRENTKEARRDKYLADASSVSSTSSSSSGGSDAQSLRTARSKRSATAPRRTRRGTASSAKLDSLPNASPKKKPVPKKKVVASKAKKPAKGKGKTAKAQAPKKAAAKAKKPVAKKKKPAAKRQPVVPSSPARSVVSAVSRTSPACFTKTVKGTKVAAYFPCVGSQDSKKLPDQTLYGVVTDHDPKNKDGAYLVCFSDGEEQRWDDREFKTGLEKAKLMPEKLGPGNRNTKTKKARK